MADSFQPDSFAPDNTAPPRVQGIPASYNGGQPPGFPKPPTPYQLQKNADPSAGNTEPINPRTGLPFEPWQQQTALGTPDLLSIPVHGVTQAVHGVEQMAEPGADAKMEGASQVLRGAAKAVAPAAIGASIPAAIAAPVATIGTMAGATAVGSVASTLGRWIAHYWGGGPGAQDLGGDLGSAAGAVLGGRVGNASAPAVVDFAKKRDPWALATAVGDNLPVVGKIIKAVRSVPERNTPTFTGTQTYPAPTTGRAVINPEPETPETPPISSNLTTPPRIKFQPQPKPAKVKPPSGPLYNPPPVNYRTESEPPPNPNAMPPADLPQAPSGGPPPNPNINLNAQGSAPTVNSVKHSAQHTDLMRQIHANGRDLDLPGSPAGSNAHTAISQAAKDVYGVNSLSELPYDKLLELNEGLLKLKKLPTVSNVSQ